MIIDIPLFKGFSLKMSDIPIGKREYATGTLQKGLVLLNHNQELDEEGVGFGVPLLKSGLTTMFPGSVELAVDQKGSTYIVYANYKLNLVEKISAGKNELVENRLLYGVKNLLAATIRRLPLVRGFLTSTSSSLRKIFKWVTTYTVTDLSEVVKMQYRIEGISGKVTVNVDTLDLRPEVTEVVVMNEQGARAFDKYSDSSGVTREGEGIGCWDEVNAEKSRFTSSEHKLSFILGQIKGTRLFRGRELVDNRLAWAGFGYSFPASIKHIQYEIEIEQTP